MKRQIYLTLHRAQQQQKRIVWENRLSFGTGSYSIEFNTRGGAAPSSTPEVADRPVIPYLDATLTDFFCTNDLNLIFNSNEFLTKKLINFLIKQKRT